MLYHISKSEFIIQTEKYLLAIPIYYKPYVVTYLEKKNLWTVEDNYIQKLVLECLNEKLLSEVNGLVISENDRYKLINNLYEQNKQKHANKSVPCCNIHEKYKQNPNGPKTSQSDNFLSICLDINSFIKGSQTVKTIKTNNEVEIDLMGDYRETIYKSKKLRNPYLLEEEIKEFKGDYFGNPFRRTKADLQSVDLVNVGINDGEKILLEEELSTFDVKDKHDMDIDSTGSTISFPSSIDNDVTKDFKELFSKEHNTHNTLKVTMRMDIDINQLQEWKYTQRLKECKY